MRRTARRWRSATASPSAGWCSEAGPPASPTSRTQVGAAPGKLGLAMLGTAAGSMTSMLLASRLIARFGVARVLPSHRHADVPSLSWPRRSTRWLTSPSGWPGMGLGSGPFAVCFGLLAVGIPAARRTTRSSPGSTAATAPADSPGRSSASPAPRCSARRPPRRDRTRRDRRAVGMATGPARRSDRHGASAVSTSVITPALLTVGFVAACAAFGEGSVVGWAAGVPPRAAARSRRARCRSASPRRRCAWWSCVPPVRRSSPAGASPTPSRAPACSRRSGRRSSPSPRSPVAIIGFGAIGAGVANVFPTVTALAEPHPTGPGGRARRVVAGDRAPGAAHEPLRPRRAARCLGVDDQRA